MIQLRHYQTGAVLFECRAPDNLDPALSTCFALTMAAQRGIDLSGADLRGHCFTLDAMDLVTRIIDAQEQPALH